MHPIFKNRNFGGCFINALKYRCMYATQCTLFLTTSAILSLEIRIEISEEFTLRFSRGRPFDLQTRVG